MKSRIVAVHLGSKYRSKCLFDASDWRKLKGTTLTVSKRGYVVAVRYDPATQKTLNVYAHRLILGVSDPSVKVDHKNGVKTDNRRTNLRLCSHSQNLANRRIQTNNVSGFRGVSRRGKKWTAFLKHLGVNRYLGTYDAADVAARVWDREAKKAFGEFSPLNFPALDSSNFFPERAPLGTNQFSDDS